MYLPNVRKRKQRGKTNRLKAKLRASNRRRVNGMAGRRLSKRLKKTR